MSSTQAPEAIKHEIADMVSAAHAGSPIEHLIERIETLWGMVKNGETPHNDDVAVDLFADAMKAKLAKKRGDGYGGWNDKNLCPPGSLQSYLIAHLDKGDPIDVANFAMMIYHRGEAVTGPGPKPVSPIPFSGIFELGMLFKEMTQGSCHNGRDVQRILTADEFRAVGVDPSLVDPEAGRGLALVQAKAAIEKAFGLKVQAQKNQEAEVLQLIEQRDHWEDKATELAGLVGKHFDIEVGEHTSANCPVQNAIDALELYEVVGAPKGKTQPQSAAVASAKQERVIQNLTEEVERLEGDLSEARGQLNMIHEHQRDCDPAEREVWYWQGDGDDHPESMVNSLPVVIRARDLKQLMVNPVQAGWDVVGYMNHEDNDVMPRDLAEDCIGEKGFQFMVPVFAPPEEQREAVMASLKKQNQE